MKKLVLVGLAVILLLMAWMNLPGGMQAEDALTVEGVAGDQLVMLQQPIAAADPAGNDTETTSVASHRVVLSLLSRDNSIIDAAVSKLDQNWHPGMATMLVEVLRFVKTPYARTKTLVLLHRKSGESFATDFDAWYRWLWKRPETPHPEYAEYKAKLYSQIDQRFQAYFRKTDNAKIRLDEIRWGGVKRDGIPPLKDPKMIRPSQATYLADSDEVFGVSLNGDSRCYPKRILAWHEMFKDTIGGMSVCGAY